MALGQERPLPQQDDERRRHECYPRKGAHFHDTAQVPVGFSGRMVLLVCRLPARTKTLDIWRHLIYKESLPKTTSRRMERQRKSCAKLSCSSLMTFQETYLAWLSNGKSACYLLTAARNCKSLTAMVAAALACWFARLQTQGCKTYQRVCVNE